METAAAAPEGLVLHSSRGFADWMASAGVSLAVTTYQAGKLFMLGATPAGQLAIFERTLPRCMGVGVSPDGGSFAVATEVQILRFDDLMTQGAGAGRDGAYAEADAVYAPHAAWITGDLDVHDVAWSTDGRPVFANTLFSCVATVSDGASFRPLWRPSFVSRLAPEDRCHLNGLALQDGRPRWVTAVAPSDVADGWRDRRGDGGLLLDMDAEDSKAERTLEGLSMPHSPRVHGERLWLLNSGRGELGWVDLRASKPRFEPVALCPGYARGLSFVGRHAVAGLSLARQDRTFSDLPLDNALRTRGAEARCGLVVIDTLTGDTVAWIRIEGLVRELFDVAILPKRRRPSLVGLLGDDIRRMISIEDTSKNP